MKNMNQHGYSKFTTNNFMKMKKINKQTKFHEYYKATWILVFISFILNL